jgi:hypothetical protein
MWQAAQFCVLRPMGEVSYHRTHMTPYMAVFTNGRSNKRPTMCLSYRVLGLACALLLTQMRSPTGLNRVLPTITCCPQAAARAPAVAEAFSRPQLHPLHLHPLLELLNQLKVVMVSPWVASLRRRAVEEAWHQSPHHQQVSNLWCAVCRMSKGVWVPVAPHVPYHA